MLELLYAVDLAAMIPIAHDIGVPHQDPLPRPDDGADASPLVIAAVLLVSILLLAALISLKRRSAATDDTQGQDPQPHV